jgi:hypothetical protein
MRPYYLATHRGLIQVFRIAGVVPGLGSIPAAYLFYNPFLSFAVFISLFG